MKKLIPLALAMALTLNLTGCIETPETEATATTTTTTTESATTESTTTSTSSGAYDVANLPEVVYKVNTSAKAATLETPGYGEAIQYFCDEIYARSEGKITMQIFTDAQLGGTTDEMIGGVTTGAFEFITLNQGSWGDYTDAFMPFNLPFLFPDFQTAYNFMDNGFDDIIAEKIADDVGVRVLAYYDMGFRHLTNDRGVVKTADDLAGLKLRTQTDPYQIATFEELGASVTTVAYSELYSALQQGLVDSQENPLSNIVLQQYYEVQDYLTLTAHNYTLTTMACSEEMWDSWNDDTKALFMEVADDSRDLCRVGLEESVDLDLAVLEAEMDVYQPTNEELQTFADGSAGVYDTVKDAIGEERYNEIIEAVAAAKQ